MSEEQTEAKAGASEAPAEPQKEAATEAKGASGREAVALAEGRGGVLGVKAGMTRVYDEDGNAIPVTVIALRPNVVTQVKTKEKDGYRAVQVGLGEKKPGKAKKADQGHAKQAKAAGFAHYQEFRMPEDAQLEGVEVGKVLSAGFLSEGDSVDLTAVSKGKGFQGVMKRHHFGGGPASHGASIVHRMPGSIGNHTDPARVFKNRKMAGQMGNRKVTTQNVNVVKVDEEKGLLLVNGSVPGPKSGIVTIRRAVKRMS